MRCGSHGGGLIARRWTTCTLAALAVAAGGARLEPGNTADAARIQAGGGASAAGLVSLERAIAADVNDVRRSHGLRPLSVAAPLSTAGEAHVRALGAAGTFNHEWPDGKPFDRWIVRFYPPLPGRSWSAGENLVWTSDGLTARRAVEAWLGSAPHRRVLLMARWREIGIGVVRVENAPGTYAGADATIAAAEFGVRT